MLPSSTRLHPYDHRRLKKTVVDALGNMQMTLSPVFYERLDNLVKPQRINRHSHKLMEMEDTLNAWHRLLSLRGWLSRKGVYLRSFLETRLLTKSRFLEDVLRSKAG